MTQNEMVLNYIKKHGSIDQRRATLDLDIMRLGARIYDLKALGVPVVKVTRYRLDANGKVARKWAEYSLDGTRTGAGYIGQCAREIYERRVIL